MRFVLFIISIAVLLGIFFVGGLFNYPNQKLRRSATNQNPAQLKDALTSTPQKTLQLRSLEFSVPSPAITCVPTIPPAIDMLIDSSGSMEDEMPVLRGVVKSFAAKLSDANIIGVADFSDAEPPRSAPAREIVPIGTFLENKSIFNSRINSIPADKDNGFTHMKDGFLFAKEKIEDYQKITGVSNWVLVFFSDGKPDVKGGGSFDSIQDPTSIANELKSSGIKIITVALGDQTDKGLMQRLASSTNDFHYAPTVNELQPIYDNIFVSIACR